MRFRAVLFATTTILLGSTLMAPMAWASAPPVMERTPDADASGAIERERAYAGLTLGDAIRQALIDDDLDFAFKSIAALGRAGGDTSTSLYYSGVRAFSQQNYQDVTDTLRDSDQDDMLTAALVSWAFVGQGKLDQAINAWEVYGGDGNRPFFNAYRGLLAEQNGEIKAALGYYAQAQKAGELHFVQDLTRRYITLLVRAGRKSDALKVHDEIFGEPKGLDPLEAQFRETITTGKPKPLVAMTPPNSVSSLMSNYASALILVRIFQANQEQNDPDSPKVAEPEEKPDADTLFVGDALVLRTALKIDPSNQSARFSLSEALGEIDEDKAAFEALNPIMTGERLNEARREKAVLHLSLEEASKAAAMLDQIPESLRDRRWWDLHGSVRGARGDFKGAFESATKSAVAARGTGEWDEDLARLSLMWAHYNLGQKAEAIEIARALVKKLKPENPVRGSAGLFLAAEPSTHVEGLPAARESLKMLGADGRTKLSLGGVLAQFPGTRAEGVQLLRDALEEMPRSPMFMNSLGYTLVEYDIDVDEGFQLLQKAYDLRPYSGAITDSLGRAHYKLGQLDEAQRLIEKAVEMRQDSPDPEIYDNLGDVYWHQGKPNDARRMWQMAKDFGGHYFKQAELEGKLKNGLKGPAPILRTAPVYVEPGSV
ncbi:MAG: tetratricopeptide repeat protein [Aquidulcibacter sp.]|jgi:tetratricopeptide (TPR) repeat protein|uniref:tetratricopeptide repeat protein n=1 Tax=Aquidulcibacter sp. TaxID=2052990 RepID=UPI0022CA03F2|nr:tetratricopeptide repeat protein [Aquidulcibacter sp.]MCE2892458.1 tetratricopeptide repeat protein [Hyphomonadaceae bacterium]MCZ8206658.1 tetratricopeptide repeat protein [Aquidulcibacter sp.]